ncbi:nudix hydrolase 14 [Arthroderma uncinatum]|uniref:nudix hydrolase 14 n=1 Tax=Arthroderma uncinatum TaxID=74035 RepID=UPI00144AD768|nr:nudix hydrolase 14 [Arthroderma uncinatum]KAF3479850.1 nudix hydrolase 14 [Arthroderma uncinatum]
MLPRLAQAARRLPQRQRRPSSILHAVNMATFTLPGSGSEPPVPVQLTSDLSESQLLSFPAFKIWLSTLRHSLARQRDPSHEFHAKPYVLRNIAVQAVDHFGARLGFVKFKADVSTDNGDKLPGSVFLRGGSVGMLPDDLPESSNPSSGDGKYAVLTVQPRIPAGSLTFVELPAGMIDEQGSFAGAAANEIQEETSLSIKQEELIDMSSLAILGPHKNRNKEESEEKESLQNAVYPSPGGCDEFIPLFLCEKRMPRADIQQMQGKLTGLRKEGEMITLKLVPLDQLWLEACRDAKALSAWALYTGLRRNKYL